MVEPRRTRPYMPDYPLEGADEGLLPWSWALERMEASQDYWVATVGRDDRPAVTPVWGVLLDGEIWFSCGPSSRKARNLAERPHVTVATDDPPAPAIVEGTAVRITERVDVERFAAACNGKYEYQSAVEFFLANALFRVVPDQVIGLVEADFTTSPTKWSFT
jgi:hypothetical protein